MKLFKKSLPHVEISYALIAIVVGVRLSAHVHIGAPKQCAQMSRAVCARTQCTASCTRCGR